MAAGSEHKSHFKEYMLVFLVLVIFTAVELVVPSIENWSTFIKGSVLTALALGKAFVVAYFYMHLNTETKILKWVAAVPCAAFLYAAVNILEAMYR